MSAKLVNALWQLYILRGYWQAVTIVHAETRIPREIVELTLDNLIDSRYA